MSDIKNDEKNKDNLKKRIFQIIDIAKKGDVKSKVFDIFIISLIVTNIICIIIETYDITDSIRNFCESFEYVSCVIFTIEYILRLWTADILYGSKKKINSVVRYIFSVNGIVELLAILPFYLPMFVPNGLIIFRSLRIIRVFRLFKVSRYLDAVSLITNVIKSKANQLLSSIFIIFVMMLASSILMFNVEHAAQPEVFKNAFSGIWWATNTIATVGYGDIYPITKMGKILSIIITFLGIGLIAIPTGIFSAGFIDQTDRLKKDKFDRLRYRNLKNDDNQSKEVKEVICPCCNERIKIR